MAKTKKTDLLTTITQYSLHGLLACLRFCELLGRLPIILLYRLLFVPLWIGTLLLKGVNWITRVPQKLLARVFFVFSFIQKAFQKAVQTFVLGIVRMKDICSSVSKQVIQRTCGLFRIGVTTVTATIFFVFKKFQAVKHLIQKRIESFSRETHVFFRHVFLLKTRLSFFHVLAFKRAEKKRGRPKKNKQRVPVSPKMPLIVCFFVISVVGVGVSLYTLHQYLRGIPNLQTLSDFKQPASTLIYDRNGVLLYSAYEDTYRVPVTLTQVPQTFIDATIAAEDKHFYSHFGFDPIAMLRAAVGNVSGQQVSGASTISQQLAKNVFLSNERTLERKLKELILAVRIEYNFEKDQVLEMYFNTISYGGVAHGVEAASQKYFSKHVQDLTEKEAVFLASLPVAPSILSKIDGDHVMYPTRMAYVLDQMEQQGKISKEKRRNIEQQPLIFSPQIAYKRAPHAVDYILSQLEEQYGRNDVLRRGVVVHTTIDLRLQNYLQQKVLEQVMSYKDKTLTNAAVIVVHPKTGEIVSMIGSVNYYSGESGQYNVVTANRQLGSTLKVVPYALALENGMKPESPLVDAPVSFPLYPEYKPRNYDGKFHGTVTLKHALANSYNIPALKVADTYGIRNVARLGTEMGIAEFAQFEHAEHVPLALTLGGVEISLEHLAQAYSVVANDGKKVPLTMVTRITNHDGKGIYQHTASEGEQVVSSQTAQTIYEILSDPKARMAAFGAPSFFNFQGKKVAIKTGTSNDVKDNVAIAFSPDFVIGVWVGNNNGDAMQNVISGYSGASSIMHTATTKVLSEYLPQEIFVVKKSN